MVSSRSRTSDELLARCVPRGERRIRDEKLMRLALRCGGTLVAPRVGRRGAR
jgi:hypothetical protein